MHHGAFWSRRAPNLEESVRVATEAAAKPVAEAAARTVAEQLVRVTLARPRKTKSRCARKWGKSSAAVAERVARELVEQANATRRSEREAAAAAAEDRLQATLHGAHSAAEDVARQTLEAAKAAMADASREVLESARAELQDSVRRRRGRGEARGRSCGARGGR